MVIITVCSWTGKSGSFRIKNSGYNSHWGIENQLHWCLDIAFNEDSCRMRSKNVAENMNLIRHIALNLLKQEKSVKMGLKSKRKKCGWDKEYLYLVLSKLN